VTGAVEIMKLGIRDHGSCFSDPIVRDLDRMPVKFDLGAQFDPEPATEWPTFRKAVFGDGELPLGGCEGLREHSLLLLEQPSTQPLV
jgi:hypothetical protein